MKRNRRHAVILTTILALLLLAGCSSAKTEDVKEESATTAQVEVNEVEQEAEVETVAEEMEESAVAETQKVEMVDWETWAAQADNEDVCVVVWNEKTGTQKILEAMPDGELDVKKYSYTVEEGDRFAVPRRDNIVYISINLETDLEWDSGEQKYMELEVKPGEITQINIMCMDADEDETYLFNF